MAIQQVTIPDFGDVQEITVVDIYVKAGDTVEVEDPLVALESEKAVMDIPSPFSGTITEVKLQEGDTVSNDDIIVLLETAEGDAPPAEKEEPPPTPAPAAPQPAAPKQPEATAPEPVEKSAPAPSEEPAAPPDDEPHRELHASPSVRSYARELSVDLELVGASGPKGRILKEDVQNFVKQRVQSGPAAGQPAAGALPVADAPLEDFSKYGQIEEQELGRIQKISGPHLHRSWITIPHVTQFDEADITELEKFRKQMNQEVQKDDLKFSPLVFVIKAVVATLKEYPLFNSSLDPANSKVIYKYYYHTGIAVDTPNGLVVPVVKDADRKGIRDIAGELASLSSAAREGKLTIGDLQGATFTISSLGGIGGIGFTPIVNGPQVAILGLSRSYMKPVWNGQDFEPRLTLPFSLSYDHRVIDGAEAARFCRSLGSNIEDLRRALL
ncbi:MAG: dihydrolipoyllysine-residue acetyltransferase [Desulfobulbaceae bacterium]|nr:MAG: dihydrolipoyllysine-residue acetyltransferase [Desulfobulbaceae bacterium]